MLKLCLSWAGMGSMEPEGLVMGCTAFLGLLAEGAKMGSWPPGMPPPENAWQSVREERTMEAAAAGLPVGALGLLSCPYD